MQVRATQLGYYDHLRRREGDIFNIRTESDFSEKWMEKVDGKAKVSRPAPAKPSKNGKAQPPPVEDDAETSDSDVI